MTNNTCLTCRWFQPSKGTDHGLCFGLPTIISKHGWGAACSLYQDRDGEAGE